MTSLKFSYNLKLLKESIKQNKHIMIMHTILLLLATILPAQISIANINQRIGEYSNSVYSMRGDYTYYISGFSAFAMIVLCLASFATMSFSYLHNSRSAIFYGSLPYKKSTMFSVRYLSGLISLLIPAVICFIVNLFVFLGHNEILHGVDLKWYCHNWMFVALLYVFIYSLCVFAANLSCNIFAQIIIMGIVVLSYPVTVFISAETVNVMLNTYMVDYSLNAYFIFPPFAAMIRNGNINHMMVTLVTAIESAVLIGLSYIAYMKRRTEKCNNFFAFNKITSILKYFITLICSAGFGLLLGAASQNNAISYVGYIVFGFIAYAVIQMIFEKSPKAMFKNMKGLSVFLIIICLVAAIPVFDILKLDTKMPDPEKLEKVEIPRVTSLPAYSSYGGYEMALTNPESIAAACELFKSGDTKTTGRSFTLKGNNSVFTRKIYHIPDDSLITFLESVYDNEDYKNEILISKDIIYDNYNIYHRLWINKNEFYNRINVSNPKVYEKLIETYNNDVLNTSSDEIDFSESYATIQLPNQIVSVFDAYEDTIALLEKEFLVVPDYSQFTKLELRNTTDNTLEHTITDPEKIKFLIDNVNDYYYDDGNSKGYYLSCEIDGEARHHMAYVSQSFLIKHNIL